MSEPKRLYKSETEKQVAGVCGGVAEYFSIDPTLVRVGYIFVTVVSGIIPGLLAYIVLAAIIPRKGEKDNG